MTARSHTRKRRKQQRRIDDRLKRRIAKTDTINARRRKERGDDD